MMLNNRYLLEEKINGIINFQSSIVSRLRAKIETSNQSQENSTHKLKTIQDTKPHVKSFASLITHGIHLDSTSNASLSNTTATSSVVHNMGVHKKGSNRESKYPDGLPNRLDNSSESHSSTTLVHSEFDDLNPADPMFSYYVTSATVNDVFGSRQDTPPDSGNYNQSSSAENSCSFAPETLPKPASSFKCTSCEGMNKQIIKLQCSMTSVLKMIQRLSTKVHMMENRILAIQEQITKIPGLNPEDSYVFGTTSSIDLARSSSRSQILSPSSQYGNSSRLVSGTATVRLTTEDFQKLRKLRNEESNKTGLVPEMRMFSPIPTTMRHSLTKNSNPVNNLRRQILNVRDINTCSKLPLNTIRVIERQDNTNTLRYSSAAELLKPKAVIAQSGDRFEDLLSPQPTTSMMMCLPPPSGSHFSMNKRSNINSPIINSGRCLLIENMGLNRLDRSSTLPS